MLLAALQPNELWSLDRSSTPGPNMVSRPVVLFFVNHNDNLVDDTIHSIEEERKLIPVWVCRVLHGLKDYHFEVETALDKTRCNMSHKQLAMGVRTGQIADDVILANGFDTALVAGSTFSTPVCHLLFLLNKQSCRMIADTNHLTEDSRQELFMRRSHLNFIEIADGCTLHQHAAGMVILPPARAPFGPVRNLSLAKH